MNQTNDHDHFMQIALEQAEDALTRGEFPVGCCIVHNGEVIATGSRQGTAGAGINETDHAEMVALRRLDAMPDATDRSRMAIYCTMEPCLMCFGAILISGIGTVVYAYEDSMGGGTACDLSRLPSLYSQRRIDIVPFVLRRRSLELFKRFFALPENGYWAGSPLSDYTLAQPSADYPSPISGGGSAPADSTGGFQMMPNPPVSRSAERFKTASHILRFWGPVVAYCAIIFIQSGGPSPIDAGGDTSYVDEFAHFVGFALMGVLCYRAVRSHETPHGEGWVVLTAGFCVLLYGLGDELHQATVPDRDGDGLDALFDALGGFTGAWLSSIFVRRKR